VLTNGARYYVDHAHPELSTPECADARSVVVFDKAAELILRQSMEAAVRLLPDGEEIICYKNNSDGKGNSYGTHENYLMDRNTPFSQIVTHATAHFITRQIFTGSGKVGTEAPGLSYLDVPYQLTARADFFEEEVGLETTLKRPIINTRDEPHADAQRYRRLHVIVGDANMSEVSTFLKVGTTAIVLAMIEDDSIGRQFVFDAPVQALRQVSYDLSLAEPIRMADDSTMTALEVQWELLRFAQKYRDDHGLESVGEDVGEEILTRWEHVLTALETDPMSLADQLDWVAKKKLLDAYRERDDMAWNDHRLRALDLQYSDMRARKSVFDRLGVERISTDAEAEAAIGLPPTDTRAYFRGQCLRRWPNDIVAANWDSLVFDLGDEPLRRVPMMEPTRGTEAHVGTLLDESSSAADLLRRLDG